MKMQLYFFYIGMSLVMTQISLTDGYKLFEETQYLHL